MTADDPTDMPSDVAVEYLELDGEAVEVGLDSEGWWVAISKTHPGLMAQARTRDRALEQLIATVGYAASA